LSLEKILVILGTFGLVCLAEPIVKRLRLAEERLVPGILETGELSVWIISAIVFLDINT
jgi:hypothetical protein